MTRTVQKIVSNALCVPADEIVLEIPKRADHGHFALPLAFSMAKKLRESPAKIAQKNAEILKNCPEFFAVENVGGYVNLTLSPEFLREFEKFFHEFLRGDFTNFPEISPDPEKILLEFVSANPTGPLHIAHARGAILGDALMRIGKFLRHEIESEYYINDAGAQMAKLGRSVAYFGRKFLQNSTESEPTDFYRGEYILDIAREAETAFGAQIFAPDPKNDEILRDFAKDLMMREITENLALLGIKFDNFVSESEILKNFPEVQKRLQKNGALYQNDGKIFLKSSEKGDEKDRVVVKSDGDLAYIAGDIAYHDHKFSRHFSRYINIFGADHHGYIPRINASLEFLGYDSARLEFIILQMVSLLDGGKPYKMSKRAGNFILLRDVVADIGADATRFIFLSKSANSPLVFDVSALQKTDASNPIFYVNYANARIHTLLKKSKLDENLAPDPKHLQNSAQNLLFFALNLPKILQNAFHDRAPHKICDFIVELATKFHAFYATERILGAENEREILAVLKTISAAIEFSCEILGMRPVRSM